MGQKTLYVKGVFLVIIRCVAVEGMLGEIIFVGQKRADAAKLQDALAAIQHGKLIHAHQLFATMSSGELKKVANIKEFIFVATILIIFQPDSYCLTCTIREYEL